MKGKIIVISAPSGCGKSTIINEIMKRGNVDLRFSVSATSRQPRQGEIDGVHYHFLTEEEFRKRIDEGMFVEYEEVYPGRFYGTPVSEIEQTVNQGHNVVLDIDVKGGVNVARRFGNQATTIFIMPPSVDELRRRLENRGTDSPEMIDQRVGKAEYEISFASGYDHVVVNDNLETAVIQTEKIIADFACQ
ncbi:MAG: guanylate kinase [Bacteroides sp.]|nr:guanylate kinase [Bacteroidales bacterium]MBD5378327.1 guanylate kinase [Bacteroides sp.]MDE5810038.1 guanylate kinase [Muribaculaceae bacterium]MDE6225157.1 guanylate kinase [Muribaculaceae bacterium]